MKPKKWSGVKEAIIMYLAVSKLLYWINNFAEVIQSDFDGAWQQVLERILTRDLPIILVVACLVVIDRAKGNRYIKLAIGFTAFVGITLVYMVALQWIFQNDPIQGLQTFRESLVILVLQYVVIGVVLELKEHFSSKIKENPPENDENQELDKNN